jgi:hypothetical protein
MSHSKGTAQAISSKEQEKRMGEPREEYGRKTQAIERADEERFDRLDYTKSAAAFNVSTGLGQTQFPRATSITTGPHALEEPSFTERLLQENSMTRLAKRKELAVPARAMSTEERLFRQCTFHPMMLKSPQRYANIKPRLLAHFKEEEPPVPDIHKSFQAAGIRGLGTPGRAGDLTSREPMTQRSQCNRGL